MLTTGTEDFFHDDSYTTIIEVAGAPSSALGVRAEHEGLSLVADEQLQVVTAAGVEELGAPDGMSVAAATLLARSMASFRRPDSTSGRHGSDLMGLLGYRDVEELAASGCGMAEKARRASWCPSASIRSANPSRWILRNLPTAAWARMACASALPAAAILTPFWCTDGGSG